MQELVVLWRLLMISMAIPATENKWLMTDLLRDQWGFKGFVVSDYAGIPEMINHGSW